MGNKSRAGFRRIRPRRFARLHLIPDVSFRLQCPTPVSVRMGPNTSGRGNELFARQEATQSIGVDRKLMTSPQMNDDASEPSVNCPGYSQSLDQFFLCFFVLPVLPATVDASTPYLPVVEKKGQAPLFVSPNRPDRVVPMPESLVHWATLPHVAAPA